MNAEADTRTEFTEFTSLKNQGQCATKFKNVAQHNGNHSRKMVSDFRD